MAKATVPDGRWTSTRPSTHGTRAVDGTTAPDTVAMAAAVAPAASTAAAAAVPRGTAAAAAADGCRCEGGGGDTVQPDKKRTRKTQQQTNKSTTHVPHKHAANQPVAGAGAGPTVAAAPGADAADVRPGNARKRRPRRRGAAVAPPTGSVRRVFVGTVCG
eukprot:TRINITY_DN7766_c0_g1_i1.p5 TRINITY_DN7766_c0_g1~~TRINITY_DN7766_c0_g1_i1.p5  ORF type:complete len:160 (+),score=15.12 TRINITY_DN7766_c0_g1_i1:1-480(+)